MKIYEQEMQLYYYDVDRNKSMKPRSILKYLSEVSATHNDMNAGQKVDKDGYGWMLNKWKVKIIKYPQIYDKIKIKTWISKIDRFFVTREFAIEDSLGNEMVLASSLWIFIDMEKRKPARLNEDLIDYDLVVDKSLGEKFTRFAKGLEMNNETSYKVRRGDIDINQHVNNLVYFDWILENVSEDIYFNYKLIDFEIDYRKEVRFPDEIKAKNLIEQGETTKIIHSISDGESELNVMALTNWIEENNSQ